MTEAETSALESELAAMDDQALVAFFQSLEVDDPRLDIVCGEMERRDVDV